MTLEKQPEQQGKVLFVNGESSSSAAATRTP